ncbi:MAG: AAA family ATPase [Leptospiraceae bacterium]|nr:AAA family ATPase [Leptospiraceae bacterium]
MKDLGFTVLETLYDGVKKSIYRAEDNDKQIVILKVLKIEYPSEADLIKFQKEYKILEKFKGVKGVAEVLGIKKYKNGLIMIFKDSKGESLESNIQKKIPLYTFYKIAKSTISALEKIHERKIIHKDLKPSNILYNPSSGDIEIIDFASSVEIESEFAHLELKGNMEGNLSYISPEQTGRVNRLIDYRSDYYSLGATFYHLLTGKPPFTATDPMDMVYSHVAKEPLSPSEINSSIPKELSLIILKLLAKNPDWRYQSSYGILYDLELISSDKYERENFFPGSQDSSLKFHLPEKLYGRKNEIKTLVDTFYYMYKNGRPESFVVTGDAGIGKSALVKELYKPISLANGYFIFGGYDQYAKNLPFSGFIRAFSILIQILLTEPSEEIQNWRIRIQSALGNNAKVITDVIPELELIIGKQAVVPSLDPIENSNRFYLIFQNFIRVFCNLNHPLVLFLDDMQWADLASLQLIRNLMSDSSLKYIFIVLAFRTTGDIQSNPFAEMLEFLKKEKTYPNTLRLKELIVQDIEQLLIDCFHSTPDEVKDLADLVFLKTVGNPFFISELLKELTRENKIYPDHKNGKWKWNIEEIRNTKISENIIDLLISKIQKLSISSQQTIKYAACIGLKFDLWTLSVIRNQSYLETIEELKDLISQDFLFLSDISLKKLNSISNLNFTTEEAKQINYQFQHDRIQNAVYELIQEDERKEIQIIIGRLHLALNFSEENIFEIVDHLNAGIDKIVDLTEKKRLIELNLQAAMKSKLSTAYELALKYLNQAFNLLSFFQEPWKEIYPLTIQVYRGLTELYYVNGQFDKLEKCVAEILYRTDDIIEIGHAYKALINYYTTIADYANAVDCGREALEFFNINLPEDNYELSNQIELKNINKYFRGHFSQSLLDAPEMKDESQKLALAILCTLMPPAYLYNPKFWIFIVLKSVSLCLRYGTSEQIFGFSCYGIILGSFFNNYKMGHEFGLLALKIAEKFENKAEITKAANVMANYTLPFREHLKHASEVNKKCFEAGRQSGEFQHMSYSFIFNVLNSFYLGNNLSIILNEIIPKHMHLCKQAKSSLGIDTINSLRIVILGMTTSAEDRMELEVIQDYEKKFLNDWKSNNNLFTVFIYKILKITNYFIQENYLAAYEFIGKAKKYLDNAVGLYAVSELNFYESLVLCALSSRVELNQKEEYIKHVKLNQKQMKEWTNSCPENFKHKYLLVEAELARVQGKFWKASKLYDEAIEDARKNEFLQNEAIANELCSNLFSEIGKTKIMRSYLLEAYYLYNRWGAVAKLNLLQNKYVDFFPKGNRRKSSSDLGELVSDSNENVAKLLDLNTVIKASQALAEEIVLEKLLKKIMRILFENAGAERGLFIKIQNNEFLVLAKGESQTEEIEVLSSDAPIEQMVLHPETAPASIINYVARIKKYIVIGDANKEELFINDQYLRNKKPKSILCYPVMRQDNLIGLIYLENNYTTDAFTKERLEVLNILSTQIAISVENSELYANLEAKVEERTANLNLALQQVKVLKEKQDGDYFLTSLLIHPLGKNNIQNDLVRVDFFIEQKKKFIFKNKEVEIGGDICTADRIFLNQRSYVVVLNADAMGKSIQGAGGILVLGSVFKSLLQRTHSGSLDNNIYPEKWIKNSFLEMQRIFESFDGYMLISLVLGLLDEERGILYYINVEHPRIVIYRNQKANFIEKENTNFRKMGIQGINSPIYISLFQMKQGDILIFGSDGRDDLIIGTDQYNQEILNFEEELFLDSVEKGKGNLTEIYNSILEKGRLTDDLSLIRLSYKEFENKSPLEIEDESQKYSEKLELLETEIQFNKKNKSYSKLIENYESYIDLKPIETKRILELSVLLFRIKNYEKFNLYGELIKLRYPQNSQNLLRLIISYIRLKNSQRASSLLNEILFANPENKKAKALEQILSDFIIRIL